MTDARSQIASLMRTPRKTGGFSKLEKDPASKYSRIGMGLGFDLDKIKSAVDLRSGLAAAGILDIVEKAKACPIYNLPTIEEVRWTLDGPMADTDVVDTFGVNIDLFGSAKQVPGVAYVESTMAQNGELQTPTLICAIGFHVEPEPFCFTAIGNAWSHPVAAGAQPPSPNQFTQLDRFNGSLGAAFATGAPTQFMVPAIMEWGWWANYVAWHMSRGYNLLWKIGQHTNIINDVLRNTAFMPDSGQDGSSSSSQVDMVDVTRRLNDKYDALGSGMNFLKVTHQRIGTVTTAPGIFNGLFLATRAYDLVNATYGGINLRSALRNNSEFRALRVPYLVDKGVPIGLTTQENDPVQAGLMRRYLSASQGQGNAIPPFITDEQNVNAVPTATGAAVMLEQTLDVAPALIVNVAQQIDADRALFKGGELKIGMKVKGFEVDEDWHTMLTNNPDLRQIVLDEAKADWAK